ncbi:MAG: anti-sigma factor family protein [Terriglobia bacterium]
MQCQDAKTYVSILHDGESVPAEAAEHIRDCAVCRTRLRDYAELAAEIRLLASQRQEAGPRLPAALPARPIPSWRRALTARMLVPRYAVAAALAIILGLSTGLGFVRAQGKASYFKYQVWVPGGARAVNGLLSSAPGGQVGHFFTEDRVEGFVCYLEMVEISDGLVRLKARALRYELAGVDPDTLHRRLDSITPLELSYVPGHRLRIPMQGGGELLMTGELLPELPPDAWGPPLQRSENELSLNEPMLIRDKELLLDWKGGSALTEGEKAAVAIYDPPVGLFVFSLQAIEGAVAAQAYRGHVRFALNEQNYILSSASPITGGAQPRTVWVFHDPNYQPPPRMRSRDGVPRGFITGVSDVSLLHEQLRK